MIIGWLVLIFTSNSTTVAIEGTKVFVKSTSEFLLPAMIFTVATVTLFSASAVIMLALLTSHKISGPLFSLTRTVQAMKDGDLTESFHIRSDDQLGHLAADLDAFREMLKNQYTTLQNQKEELNHCLHDPRKNADQIRGVVQSLSETINYFKIGT